MLVVNLRKVNKLALLVPLSFTLLILGIIYPPISLINFIIIAIYILVEADIDSICAFMIFFYPFSTVFKIAPGTLSLLTIIQLLFCIRFLICNKFPRNYVLATVLFVMISFFDLFNGYTNVLKQILIPFLIYAIVTRSCQLNKEVCLKLYVLAVLLSSVLGYFKDSIPNLASYVETISMVYSPTYALDRFGGLWEDPNYYSVNLFIALSIVVILHIKGRIKSYVAFGVYAILIIFGSLTGSKSFMLMLPVLFFAMLYSSLKSRRYGLAMILMVVGIGGVFLIFQGKIKIFDTIIERLLSASTGSDLTTGRSDLWLGYLRYMNEHFFRWIFGNGINAPFVVNACHNTYLDFIYYYGIIGSIIFLYMITYPLKYYYFTREFIYYIPLVIVAIMYFFLSELAFFDFPFHLIICFILICDRKKELYN